MPDTMIATPMPAGLIDSIRAVVGDRGLLSDPHDTEPYLNDWRRALSGQAAAVVRPASTEEVAAVVRLCHQTGVAIVPQGGNTGLMGGGTPVGSGAQIVLSMTRMNKVLAVDTAGYTMTVESGCVLKTIQESAAEHDRLFPLSLGAEGSCAIGGNLSTNAGGVQVLHYGNARNLVLGLEVVLPDGKIWNGLRALKKDNTGYDLKHLFMGAEGTLGIITKAVLKLWPKPKDVATAWVAVRDPAAALQVLAGAHSASEDNVTSCELLHRDALDGVFRHVAGVVDPLPARNTWFLLMEWSSSRVKSEGAEGMAEKMEAYLADCLEKELVMDAVLAQTEAQAKNMWKIREGHAEAGRAAGPSASYDISVAIAKIPEFIEQTNAAVLEVLPSIRPRPFGHMGDGNLHYGFAAPEGMDRTTWRQYTPEITRRVHDTLARFDGSISAEHGIGSEKIAELEHYRSDVELDVMRAIKRALDPQNLMNPGKILRV